MSERFGTHPQFEHRAGLLERLNRMVEADRLTEEEAARLRGATDANEFDDAIRDVRSRHAIEWIDEAVGDGRVTEETHVADHPRYPESGDDTGVGPDDESKGLSLWSKVLIVVFGLLVLAALVLHLAAGGMRH